MAEQTLKEKTAKGLFWGGLSNGVQQVLNLVFGLILARILNASDYGMVGMLAIFSAIASTIQESGFTAALTNQKEIRHEDYNAVFWFSTLTGVLFYLILFFCAPLIAAFYDKPELIGLSRVVFLSFLFGGIGIAPNAYMFKVLMVKERAKIDVVSLICSGTIGVILALNGFAYYGLAIQTTVYIGIGAFFKFLCAPWKPSLEINLQPLKSMFGFGSKLILTNIFTQISNNIFSVILGKFYTPRQLGFYSQGQKWMIMGHTFIGGMISAVAQPVLVQVISDKERLRNIFRKMIRFGAFVSFPTMLGLAFVAPEFVLILLGEKWLPAVPFLQLFCIWGAGGYIKTMCFNLLMALGKSNICLYGTICINVLQMTALCLLYKYGIEIMLISYIIVNYIGIAGWTIIINHYTKIHLFDIIKDISPYLLVVCFSLFMASLIVGCVSENLFFVFLSKILLVAISYIILMWKMNSVIFKEFVLFFFNGR